MTPVSDATVVGWWLVALALGVLVLVVVAVLLEMIVRTAKKIHRLVSDIWTSGTHIAANTVTIALLQRTNYLARALLESAGRIAAASSRIQKATGRKL